MLAAGSAAKGFGTIRSSPPAGFPAERAASAYHVIARGRIPRDRWRTTTEQRVALGAKSDGTLAALIHTGVAAMTTHNACPEQFTFPARHLYAADAVKVGQQVADMDMLANTFMRGPGESLALTRSNVRSTSWRKRCNSIRSNCVAASSPRKIRHRGLPFPRAILLRLIGAALNGLAGIAAIRRRAPA